MALPVRCDGAWRLKKRRLGLAWQQRTAGGGWRKRRGRCPEGWLDERAAQLAAVAAMEAHAASCADEARRAARRRRAHGHGPRTRARWLRWLEEVRGAKPSTIADYRLPAARAGPSRTARRSGMSRGRIMAAFGDRPAAEVTTAEVSRFLRSLDARGPDAAQRQQAPPGARRDVHLRLPRGHLELPINPVDRDGQAARGPAGGAGLLRGRGGRGPRARVRAGKQRTAAPAIDEDERAARDAEDRQDAEAFRLLFYTGLRLGEVLTLRWEDVDLVTALAARPPRPVRRRGDDAQGPSAPVRPALRSGARRARSPRLTRRVRRRRRLRRSCNRFGRRLDPSALRRRYKLGPRPPVCGRSGCTACATLPAA